MGLKITNLSTDGAKFTNINQTYNGKIGFFGLNNALIYNTNNSIYGNSDISLNDGNINITLTPNNYSYVLDNFNLTEGITRQNNPIWYKSSTTSLKEIASNLTNTINTTILTNIVDSSCSINSISSITINNTQNNFFETLSIEGNPRITCYNSGVLRINNVSIENSTSSTIIKINYVSRGGVGGGGGGGGGDSEGGEESIVYSNITNISETGNLSNFDVKSPEKVKKVDLILIIIIIVLVISIVIFLFYVFKVRKKTLPN